jgi:alpha-1,2-mannosyltransferase
MTRERAAHAVTALALMLGLFLFGLGLLDQWRRLRLDTGHGLGFADPACTTGYCDYTMFWLAGFLARHGGALYDHARYATAAAAILPYKTGYWPFVYPPTFLLPAMVISLAPLAAGYYGFCLLTTGLSIFLLRRAGIARWCILAGLAGPAAMWNLYLGQFGLLCGALLLAGLSWMETKPVRAGGVLALLCIKPQYALLAPIVVLAGRYWRVMLAGMLVVFLLLALSLVGGGPKNWAGYLGPGRAAMKTLLENPFGTYEVMGTSVFWMARSLGASIGGAYLVQALATCLAALSAWHLWRIPAADPMRRAALTVFLTLLASPYGFTDDLAVYSVLLPVLARRGAPWRNAALAWLWVAPAFVPRFVAMCGFLPTPLLVMGAAGLAYTLRSKNNPCSPNRFANPRERRHGAREPASSAASHSTTL